jgi:hypothetical protein
VNDKILAVDCVAGKRDDSADVASFHHRRQVRAASAKVCDAGKPHTERNLFDLGESGLTAC